MAIVTVRLGGDGTPPNNVEFFYDYDDATMRLTALRCINNTDQAAWGMARQVSNKRAYDMRFPPGTTEITIPQTPAQRMTVFVDARGRIDGVEYFFMWPYP